MRNAHATAAPAWMHYCAACGRTRKAAGGLSWRARCRQCVGDSIRHSNRLRTRLGQLMIVDARAGRVALAGMELLKEMEGKL